MGFALCIILHLVLLVVFSRMGSKWTHLCYADCTDSNEKISSWGSKRVGWKCIILFVVIAFCSKLVLHSIHFPQSSWEYCGVFIRGSYLWNERGDFTMCDWPFRFILFAKKTWVNKRKYSMKLNKLKIIW